MRWAKVVGLKFLLICCGTAWLSLTAAAAPVGSDARALQESQDAELVEHVFDWNEKSLELPENMNLDPSLRDAAVQLVRAQAQSRRAQIAAWVGEEHAASKDPNLRRAQLAHALLLRSINEMAIWSVESLGPAHDEVWTKAALVSTACASQYQNPFAQRVAMIQAAPLDARPALLAGEKELLARWGTTRRELAPRPSVAQLTAADRAIARLGEGLPEKAAPMTPFLAGQVFARDRKAGKSDRWEQCAKSQWWFQSQLANSNVDRTQALTVYRYSTMLDANEYVPAAFKSKSEPTRLAEGKPMYPRAALYFQVEGTTTVQVNIDDQGKALSAEVVARDLRVPGVRNNRPLAYESLLDDASLDFARQRSYPVGKAGAAQFVMNWTLQERGDDAQ